MEEPMNHDKRCLTLIEDNPNMIIPWFLMACYAYDKPDDPIITDVCFDEISGKMFALWDKLEHKHKSLINYKIGDPMKGSSVLVSRYPSIVKGAVGDLKHKEKNKCLWYRYGF